MALFPHVLVKEATFEVYFGPTQGTPPIFITPPQLPDGYVWLSQAPNLLANPRTPPPNARPLIVNAAEAAEATKKALEMMLQSKAKNQACHREQFEEWKLNVDGYTKFFQRALVKEKDEEREQVKIRLKKSQPVLIKQGFGCTNMRVVIKGRKEIRGSDMVLLSITARGGRIPELSEFGYGRCLLITPVEKTPDMDNQRATIYGEIEEMSRTQIVISTTFDYIPESPSATYRVDLGPHVTTYERIENILNQLQRQEPVHVGGRMGIFNPGTQIANTLFSEIEKTSADAKVRDPSKRPVPDRNAPISIAAAMPHRPYPAREPRSHIPPTAPLNEYQMEAYKRAVQEKQQLSFIQGPPGTGKTYTAIEIVIGWLRDNKGPVLVTAFSNKGTDNLAAGLYNRGINVARIGAGMPAPWRVDRDETAAIKRADVIAVTCIGAGMSLLKKMEFPFVVIDEAAQVMEPACMIPCTKGMVQCVMVGDQCQLPCTIISTEAEDLGLGVSMFERMLAVGMDMQILGIQYRMHALISHFPSWRFYKGELKTGVPCEKREHEYGSVIKSSLGFVHVDGCESRTDKTILNTEEAHAVAATAAMLYAKGCDMSTVGVITPYAGQVREIQRTLKRYLPEDHSLITVASVDSFQGQENEIIMLSLVRSNSENNIGFVNDWRRLNVSLTRAKRMCLLFGDATTLSGHQLFRDWFGFHASLPRDTCSWMLWKHGGLYPMTDNAKLTDLVSWCQGVFAERSLADVRKHLPLHGDYPGMIVEAKLVTEEIKKDIDKRRRGKKATAIEPSIEDKEKKVMQTDDEVFKSWVKGLSALHETGGVGDWTEVAKLTKSLGLTLPDEMRVDPADNLPYTKQDFIDAYGGTAEWDAAEAYTEPDRGGNVGGATVSRPAQPAPPASSTPAAVIEDFPRAGSSSFPRQGTSTMSELPQKEHHVATADEKEILAKIAAATSVDEIERLEAMLLQEKRRQKQKVAATRAEEKDKAQELESEVEMRVDLNDGLLYAKEDFVAQYGGTKEWDAAPHSIERRIDPADGLAYTKADFVSQYGGTKEWDAAGVKKIEAKEEKRIDPSDGMAYTKEEFMACYGGEEEWNAATTHEELPQRRRRKR
eukprot:TRINITY_DN589_c0_g1_i1.p1 TRINITY_DN589_c0_g1~~TRINITY_DN589_c0_g1_i1.p1  ORF type:complete len:1300 (+),score=277.94 TRINITY_DN589_c0_g1_i1:577-3900(+)